MENTVSFKVTSDMLASRGQRFVNYIIDIIMQYILLFILAFITVIVSEIFSSTAILEWMQDISDLEGTILFVAIMILYCTLLESYFSRTIGKYITKTMVVLKDGSKPNSQIILKRTLCRIIPFDALTFLGNNARGWHDSFSDTYVVKKDIFERKRALLYSFEEIGKKER
ncbi:RDD family protein [Flavobacterium sp.]|uniref:RDD family protein n=1 Tax=Flavobacterium sp. TaxID=239 RepID=UPI003D6BB67C